VNPSRTLVFDARAAVTQCWNTQCLLLLSQGLLMLVSAAVKDDFRSFLADPGEPGWRLFCFVLPVYAVMPWLVRLVDRRAFRWFAAVMLLLSGLMPVAHQAKHISQGQMPDVAVVVEVAMVLCGLAGSLLAARWARQAGPAA
jgi:hypothetical protein